MVKKGRFEHTDKALPVKNSGQNQLQENMKNLPQLEQGYQELLQPMVGQLQKMETLLEVC